MYKIKQQPDDFKVWELPQYTLSDIGEYSYFWLKKTNLNTIDALKQLSARFNLPLKNFGYAGAKDKVAITEQVISIRGLKSKIDSLRMRSLELTSIGQGENPISLGQHEGNKFRIVIRNLPLKKITVKSLEKIPNYFGEQRFSENNIEIGKLVIKKNFRKAIELTDYPEAKYYLDDNPTDAIGAMRNIPEKLRKMFVHAYQSMIWNKTVERYLVSGPVPIKNEMIPIVGFATKIRDDRLGNIIRDILAEESIILRDFIIPQMPEMTSEGGERPIYVKPEEFEMTVETDELNESKQKAIIMFTLPKGSYATVVVDYLFKEF